MRIAVVGASGRLGQHIVLEAEQAGISVISVSTTAEHLAGNGIVLIKSYDALQRRDLEKCHAVLDLLSFDDPDAYRNSILPFAYLRGIMPERARLIARGQSMFLFTDRSRRQRVYDTQCATPPEHARTWREIFERFCDIDFRQYAAWNVLCPPLILDEQAPGGDDFRLGDDILPVSISGSSYISLRDYARGFVELLKRADLTNRCCSIFGLTA